MCVNWPSNSIRSIKLFFFSLVVISSRSVLDLTGYKVLATKPARAATAIIIGKEIEKKKIAMKAIVEIASIQLDVMARLPIRSTASTTMTKTAALIPRNAALIIGRSE